MARSEHNTLTATTVATVTLDDVDANSVYVKHRGTGSPIYFTLDGTAPTVAGDGTYVVAAGETVELSWNAAGGPTVKLISAGAEDYSVGVH